MVNPLVGDKALNVIKISRVRSATDLVNPLVFPLTFFDLLWLKRNPVERVTFYRLADVSCDSFYSVILPKLEQSLSLALTHFLPLCGHLKWNSQDPKPCIVIFPHDALSFTVAETDADFSHLSNKGLRPEVELRALVPELSVSSDSASIFSLQITLFPNQGFCIGTAAHHAVMDGKTGAKFYRLWSHICKHGAIPQDFHLPTLLDRSVINVPDRLESKIFQLLLYTSEDKDSARTLKMLPSKKIDDKVVRITLELTQDDVEKLRERAKNESTRSDLHMSTFVVTYAYVLSCWMKASGGDVHRPVLLRYAADFRNRLDPPVPERYFGNCVLPIDFYYEAKTFLGEDGFINGVEILSDSVKGLGARGIESIWEVYEEGIKMIEFGTQKVSVTGSNQFGIYESDFGWGRPVNTEVMSMYQNSNFSMSRRRDESGGVEIGICLNKCEMDVFLPLFTNGLDNCT